MKKRIVNAFFVMAFGGTLLFSSIPNSCTLTQKLGNEKEEQLNTEVRAGISLMTTDIGDMNSYANVISNKIVSTASAASNEVTDDTILISYDNYYVKDNCNVMKDHTYESDILYTVQMNDVIYASNPLFNDGVTTWSYVAYRNDTGDISLGFIDSTELLTTPIASTDYSIPSYSGFKSYMDYRSITTKTSPAYTLSYNGYTGNEGIRMYNGRYLIAIGMHFNASVGDYVDLTLENGTVIKGIIGDRKSWRDTEASMLFTSNGCMSEFIVQEEYLSSLVKHKGNISFANENWDSPVVSVKIYDKNALYE